MDSGKQLNSIIVKKIEYIIYNTNFRRSIDSVVRMVIGTLERNAQMVQKMGLWPEKTQHLQVGLWHPTNKNLKRDGSSLKCQRLLKAIEYAEGRLQILNSIFV